MCFDSSEQERFDAFEFIVLIPLPTRSMLFMISAHDSIAMYLAIEPQSLCFYVMAASKRKSEFSTEAGSKYLILGAFSSGILLFGCNLGNERKRGPILQLEERPVGSPNPDPASHVLQVRRDPVPNYRLLPELRYRSRARNGQRLGHRNLDRLRAGKRKPPRPDQSKQQCRIRPPLALNSQAATSFPKINKGRSAAYCSRKHPTYTIVKSSAYLSDIRYLIAIKG
ncbi:hypothetical protein VNO80_33115 [Phaseolus coccineus]|uniref:NADH:quinone oxidoreductase/Mrp antiporter transmembrane domain-containing protein n=1 Tax=Phaseolus coccineus TaxID=3886 RepID=A0AAN9KYP2_PHACN